MRQNPRKLPRHGTVNVFRHLEVSREEYVKVALVNLVLSASG